eukprot:SAG11_NODE_2796_length_2960_cov_3.574275_3_plen_92_part_00
MKSVTYTRILEVLRPVVPQGTVPREKRNENEIVLTIFYWENIGIVLIGLVLPSTCRQVLNGMRSSSSYICTSIKLINRLQPFTPVLTVPTH